MSRNPMIALAVVIPFVLCVSANGAVIRVPSQQPTIQQGIDAASEGDTVLVAPGTYTGTLNRDLDFGGTNLALVSEGGAEVTVIDCEQLGRGFYFDGGEDARSVVVGFTVLSGRAEDGGAVFCRKSSPGFRECTFEGNQSVDDGGAFYSYEASPVIEDCTFFGNSAELALQGYGGGLYCEGIGTPLIRGCLFWSNSSDMGGAICCLDGCSLELTRCVITANAGDSGGAVACRSGSVATVTSCTLAGNMGVAASGIYSDGSAHVDVQATIISFGYKGEAVLCWSGGTVDLVCTDVYANEYGDWIGCIAGQSGLNGNLWADPLYCGHAVNPDDPYSLNSESPCAPACNPECGLIGARDVGCGASPVESIGWGEVKALFR